MVRIKLAVTNRAFATKTLAKRGKKETPVPGYRHKSYLISKNRQKKFTGYGTTSSARDGGLL
jgi:hypothetical protein